MSNFSKLNQEGCFGEIAFFTGQSRISSAKSKDYSTLFSIKRSDFLSILMENADDFVLFLHLICFNLMF